MLRLPWKRCSPCAGALRGFSGVATIAPSIVRDALSGRTAGNPPSWAVSTTTRAHQTASTEFCVPRHVSFSSNTGASVAGTSVLFGASGVRGSCQVRGIATGIRAGASAGDSGAAPPLGAAAERVAAATDADSTSKSGEGTTTGAGSTGSNAPAKKPKFVPKYLPVKNLSVGDVLTWKAADSESGVLFTVAASTPVVDVVKDMAAQKYPTVIVVDGDTIVGSFYDRDYVMQLTHGPEPATMPVSELMQSDLFGALPTTRLTDAVAEVVMRSYFVPVMSSEFAHGQVREHKAAEKAAIAAMEAEEGGTGSGDEVTTEDVHASLPSLPVSSLEGVISARDIVAYCLHKLDSMEAPRPRDEPLSEAPRDDKADAADDASGTVSKADSASSSTSSDGSSDSDGFDEGIDPRTLAYNRSVGRLLESRRKDQNSMLLNTVIDDNITADVAANEMAESDISNVVVVDNEHRMVGVFTALDYIRRVIAAGKDPTKTLVRDVMTSEGVRYARPEDKVLDAARAMLDAGVRHMPVIDSNTSICVGMLCLTDILQTLFPEPEKKPPTWALRSYFSLVMNPRRTKPESEAKHPEPSSSSPSA